MNNFFKFFFASFLALFIFSLIGFLILLGFVSSLSTPEKENVGLKAVLVLDLSRPYAEITENNPVLLLASRENFELPTLYDVVRMINRARRDSAVKGILVQCGTNANGFGASEEIRNALQGFKSAGKFVYAYGAVIPQGAYHVASVADKIYINPVGGVEWKGFSMQSAFLKGTLDKLEIEPQVFYAGKFKSATEPFRETEMTEPNRVQTLELLNDLYNHFLLSVSQNRKIDTAELRRYADQELVQFAGDALQYKLVDGLKYDDEVKEEIKQLLKVDKYDKLNLVSFSKYSKATEFKQTGKEKIAVIYAQGEIVDGKGERDRIGSDSYRNMIRRARLDKSIRGIVLRVNSPGGSALASEEIWREIALARKEKPVVVSFGDVSASGGYYLSCGADSIFAQPNTITGSIGVFMLLPNMQKFFNNKLGITFDGVQTTKAEPLTNVKPLTESQKRYLQAGVDSIYMVFKTRVAEGRKRDINYIDSIAQGRVWSGTRAVQLGLVDRLGGLQDAIACVARMARISDYRLREYPEKQTLMEMIFGSQQETIRQSAIKEELGAEAYKTYNTIRKVQSMVGQSQARLPFDFTIE